MTATEMRDKIFGLTGNFSGLFFRMLAFGISSIFFSVYPIYIFLIYMAANGFYAYEMPDNFFSLRVFFLTTLVTLALLAGFLMFSLIETITDYRKLSSVHWFKRIFKVARKNILFLLVSVFIWLVLIVFALNSKDALFPLALVVAFLLGLLFLLILFASGRTYFIVLAIYVSTAFLQPLLDPRPASSLLEIGLRKFNVGGVDVELDADGKKTAGHLVFLSPNYIYIRYKSEHRLAIIPRTDSISLTYAIKQPEPNGSNPAVHTDAAR
jgi:hypothetical protein